MVGLRPMLVIPWMAMAWIVLLAPLEIASSSPIAGSVLFRDSGLALLTRFVLLHANPKCLCTRHLCHTTQQAHFHFDALMLFPH